jgi:hypothetical protein
MPLLAYTGSLQIRRSCRSGFPLFDLLPEQERQAELLKLKILRYGADQVVYERGSDCLDVFFIFEGLTRIDRCARRGDMGFSITAARGRWSGIIPRSRARCRA